MLVGAQVLLQSGTCSSYFVVTGSLAQSIWFKTTPLEWLIIGQLVILVPLSAIRKVASLWPLNLLGSMLIIVGIVSSVDLEVQQISSVGLSPSVEPTNFEEFFVCLGTACFMFEGIGLVLPTYESSGTPGSVSWVYSMTMLVVLTMVSTVGCLGYLAYGDEVEGLILLNFPADNLQVFIRLAFMIQVVCSYPLQLLPAVFLLEGKCFTPMSSPPWSRRWKKTGFRALYTVFLSLVAIGGSSSFDNFISMIGAVCGIPLAFVFPAICHFALVAKGKPLQRLIDGFLVVVGVALAVTVTIVNIRSWVLVVKS
jgi:proton-coupled amino acid transporter